MLYMASKFDHICPFSEAAEKGARGATAPMKRNKGSLAPLKLSVAVMESLIQ